MENQNNNVGSNSFITPAIQYYNDNYLSLGINNTYQLIDKVKTSDEYLAADVQERENMLNNFINDYNIATANYRRDKNFEKDNNEVKRNAYIAANKLLSGYDLNKGDLLNMYDGYMFDKKIDFGFESDAMPNINGYDIQAIQAFGNDNLYGDFFNSNRKEGIYAASSRNIYIGGRVFDEIQKAVQNTGDEDLKKYIEFGEDGHTITIKNGIVGDNGDLTSAHKAFYKFADIYQNVFGYHTLFNNTADSMTTQYDNDLNKFSSQKPHELLMSAARSYRLAQNYLYENDPTYSKDDLAEIIAYSAVSPDVIKYQAEGHSLSDIDKKIKMDTEETFHNLNSADLNAYKIYGTEKINSSKVGNIKDSYDNKLGYLGTNGGMRLKNLINNGKEVTYRVGISPHGGGHVGLIVSGMMEDKNGKKLYEQLFIEDWNKDNDMNKALLYSTNMQALIQAYNLPKDTDIDINIGGDMMTLYMNNTYDGTLSANIKLNNGEYQRINNNDLMNLLAVRYETDMLINKIKYEQIHDFTEAFDLAEDDAKAKNIQFDKNKFIEDWKRLTPSLIYYGTQDKDGKRYKGKYQDNIDDVTKAYDSILKSIFGSDYKVILGPRVTVDKYNNNFIIYNLQ